MATHSARVDTKSLLGLCVVAFLSLGSYGLARPAIDTWFVEVYTQKGLPWAWLVESIVVILAVAVYNRFAKTTRVVSLFVGTACVTAGVGALLLSAVAGRIPGAVFALYIWKDLYAVFLVESFWMIANVAMSAHSARKIYGVFCAAGSLGAMAGNLLVGTLATRIGTKSFVAAVIPLLVILGLVAAALLRSLNGPVLAKDEPPKLGRVLEILRRSRYLLLMVALIALTQFVINFIDYEFQRFARESITDLNQRTSMVGFVWATINAAALVLQLATGPIIGLLGIAGTLIAAPLIVGASIVLAWIVPVFATVAAMKVAAKSLDYSLFRASKEMLYLPLPYEEKTEGKAVVDIATYRMAKGGASVLLIGLQAIGAAVAVKVASLGLVAIWAGVTRVILGRHREISG